MGDSAAPRSDIAQGRIKKLHRDLGIIQKTAWILETAWILGHKIREAWQAAGEGFMLDGVDETYVGGLEGVTPPPDDCSTSLLGS